MPRRSSRLGGHAPQVRAPLFAIAANRWAAADAPPLRRVGSGRRSYASGVDAYLAVASKRDQRLRRDPVPEDAEGGSSTTGIAGSAKNRPPWRFLVIGDRGLVDQVAQTVYAPPKLLGARW